MTAQLRARPSGAKVWLNCPLGLTMQNLYGDRYPAGSAAEEGTAAHWVKEQLRAGIERLPEEWLTAPNGVSTTNEMLQYGKEANAHIDKLAGGGKVYTELKIDIRFGKYTLSGTVDDVALPPDGRALHQADYKYGHTHVPADSEQNRIYGIGLRQRFLRERVTLHVIQPRDYTAKPTRSYDFTPAEQLQFCERVEAALDAAHEKHPAAKPGGHCLRCPGRGHCAELRNASLTWTGRCSTDTTAPEAVAAELVIAEQALELAKARLTGLQDEAQHVINGGGLVPGWSLERKPGREQWNDEQPVLQLSEAFGLLDSVSQRKLITPNQAIKAGLPAELVRMHTSRPMGEPKLVRTGETLAARVFSGETE